MRTFLILASSLVSLAMACGGGQDHPANAPDNVPPIVTPMVTSDGGGMMDATAPAPHAEMTPSQGSQETNSGATNMMPGATATGSSGQSPSTGMSPSQPQDSQSMLTDDQILDITHTANAAEIAQAKLALTKALDARVKKFATMMLHQHAEADSKGNVVVKKDHLTMATSPMGTTLTSDTGSATHSLKGVVGAEFDRAYVDTQIHEHQSLLDALDQKLIPAAQNADVKSYLSDVRSQVSMHLEQAHELQSQIQSQK